MVHKLSLASGLVVLLTREILARTSGKTLPLDRTFVDANKEFLTAQFYDSNDPVSYEQAQEDDKPSELGDDTENQIVGVKPHSNHRKSNAVGDPDGEGSDDDDSDDEDSDFMEELRRLYPSEPQVQVQLELVQDAELEDETNHNIREIAARRSGGGVGLRLGQKLQNRRKNRTKTNQEAEQFQRAMVDAWNPYVFCPPTSLTVLKENARKLDGDSKLRLDRRTLYGCLLLEWRGLWTTERRFLQPSTSQALQAALSLATQPSWRKSLAQASALRLYDSQNPDQGATLAMQETVALALAHSLGAGLVFLDDEVLSSVRQHLLDNGVPEQELKPGVLIQSLLKLASEGKLEGITGGSISQCMSKDIRSGLDDPFDERASDSCANMKDWELDMYQATANKPLPLVVFVRASSSSLLFQSKSAVETLLHESNAADGINLIILGKGIDSKTQRVPEEPAVQNNQIFDNGLQDTVMRNAPGAAPWFGFSPNNQNASGQHDPEGSRRFNIFLARTIDPDGTPGILGAIAPPQAGNLFPHMMAMQARERLQNEDDDSPIKAELERWASLLQQQMQTNGGAPLPPPQFFNASLSGGPFDADGSLPVPPPPHVIQETLQHAMAELLDRLASLNDEDGDENDFDSFSPDLHKAFSQVLRNENLRKGIAENLARAAPALSDPKCQGVMLSVYVPPPPNHINRGKLPEKSGGAPMSGWFQKILNHQDEATREDPDNPDNRRNSRQRRTRTMAAAAAVMQAKKAEDSKEAEKIEDNKAERNLARLEAVCRPIVVEAPTDPVRAKSWNAWIQRERGAVIFRNNRKMLIEALKAHNLAIQDHTGTRGAGSSLRQMLSVRDITADLPKVIKHAIELEASRNRRKEDDTHRNVESMDSLDVDITLSQLMLTENGLVENNPEAPADDVRFVHPSTLESALTMVCRISSSPSGGLSLSGAGTVAHRTREEITALAQDKHERALISQVVSPQDIGVTYDMIGGLSEVKELLRQSITYPLKYPHLYSEGIAREAVKGVLLFGPPGTGKTMLAKAVATEGGASFLSVDASSVENKWLGESEKNAKAVFTLARRLAPCVIFIDEVDSLLSSREGSSDDSAHGTLTSVKTTMMSEWDGLNSGTNGSGDRVVVIGSTNRPFDLDEAVLRRFPRRILVDLPDLKTRSEILEVTLAENRIDPAVNFTKIAERLEGYTGSDIKEVCREAVVQISHEQAKQLDEGLQGVRMDTSVGSLQRLRPVTVEDFEKALSKLKRSVSENGRELARVWEWNAEYGEVKKMDKDHLPHLANMYL
ncbi:hypothetical protein FisN_34Hh023 [Fistulifera solaris]|uniref:AAA+ ATPase domain-containing protein n=1 Tax=Fistulifera solaris TaxID=1519565 RepID=A0A1Z5JB99_FISSO|nr:hypothetical protein FisN_34Hh023 [Fistulifera solaris]|eukprot:GAX11255.1 hypothetical protein FisN_34Hh023 [Fistulifera solaris]